VCLRREVMSEVKSFTYYGIIIIKICKITGYSTFSIDSSNVPYRSLLDYVLFISSFMAGCLIIFYSWIMTPVIDSSSILINYGNLFSTFAAIIIALICMLSQFLNYKKIWSFVTSFDNIYKKVPKNLLSSF
jgi:hypothetical protein